MAPWSSGEVPRQVSTLHPDVTRFNFWRPHATPVQASLLRLTGWLDDDADQEVPVVSSDGAYVFHESDGRTVRATLTSRPKSGAQVLFRLETPGTRDKANWEAYFVSVYRLRDLGLKVRQRIAQTDAKLIALDAEAAKLDQRWAELRDRMERERASLLSALTPKGPALVPPGALGLRGSEPVAIHQTSTRWSDRAVAGVIQRMTASLEAERDELEREDNELKQRRVPFELMRKNLEPKIGRMILPGIFPVINAFLSVQALTAATVAMEEFRKTPRHDSAVIEEMEARLATD